MTDESCEKPENDQIYYLICKKSEYDYIISLSGNIACELLATNDLDCYTVAKISQTPYHFNVTVQKKNILFFLFANCNLKTEISYSVQYTYLNPNGEQLSTIQQPAPKIYLSFLIIFSILLLIWLKNWFSFREQKIKLHKLLTFLLIYKIASLALVYLYWSDFSKNGKEISLYFIISYIVNIISQFLFYAALLFISKGWSITRQNLLRNERILIYSIVLILVASIEIQIIFPYDTIIYMFFFIMSLFLFFLLRILFVSTAKNMYMLSVQLLLIRRVSLVGLFLTYYYWIVILLKLIVDLILYLGIGITFKLRPFNDLFEQAPIRDVDIPEEYLSNAQDIYSQLIEEDDDDDDLQDWEQGIPLPNYDAYGKVIAIENIGKDGDIVIGETELQEVEKKKNTKSKSESEK
ncbi:lung seven transmembrane receptor [Anaeramoeba flamelloides]|uniref:Lung seven transmembrane receptor n=1 Tax=Anaeramoeba flamelloides TaxID=1746091 RepID=A0AAV7ZCA3_9EUKA|nr:lung seven transmembrane receptor [Anaeramoeba flamelloides]